MVAQRNEQVEEKLRATGMHLDLHRAATLECPSAADDEGEVVRTELGVRVGGVGVGVAGRGEDGRALYAGLCIVQAC